MRATLRTATVTLVALGSVGCETDDVGKPCGDIPSSAPADPIGGETPVIEPVRFERAGTCESFVCLTHGGYDPYCTRTCSYEDSKKGADCTADSDCNTPKHCFEGKCQDDDCPSGFQCRAPHATGPLDGSLYCVYIEGCRDVFDCEDAGRVACKDLICLDQCRQDSECEYRRLVCLPRNETPCACPDGAAKCEDAELQCQAGTDEEPWPAGTAQQRGVCQLEEQ